MAKRISAPTPKKTSYTFEELYAEFWGPLQKQFFYMEKDYHLAEDLAQETLLRVWQYWDRIQWDKLGGVIGTIANNVRYGYVRKEFDRVDTELYDNVLEFECHDDGLTDPIRELLSDEASNFVQEAFESLKDSERELFADIYLKNLETKDVAKKHRMTANNIYVSLHRIRNRLIVNLEPHNVVLDD
ncbi:RNA polymerase sigma factor [Salmonella phage SeKF_80]|jgi:RNA polymerase sigma factor, sigma-70 family|uniref:RNA polymerase ECF sigma factor n=2 Tax=Moazamivirus TaxID=3044766 RepID=G0X4Y0_9CAUD|nr:RNA polymerase sigma factor [Salmonella phage 7-11]YP_010672086.1 RNA polymerase ECF-type sigma factor [Salmonella phage SE131]AEK81962.1 RNA polymerase ECF sigma factor [Salmonella phage 7-11]AVJ48237.1 RNA polymerase ECF-type sigma factor [Salmonella phage SE131]